MVASVALTLLLAQSAPIRIAAAFVRVTDSFPSINPPKVRAEIYPIALYRDGTYTSSQSPLDQVYRPEFLQIGDAYTIFQHGQLAGSLLVNRITAADYCGMSVRVGVGAQLCPPGFFPSSTLVNSA
jgi:hypothetical protein